MVVGISNVLTNSTDYFYAEKALKELVETTQSVNNQKKAADSNDRMIVVQKKIKNKKKKVS